MARQREVTMKKQVKQIQGSSQRSLLARAHLHQKVLVPVPSLCRGCVVLSLLLLPTLTEREETSCRKKILPLPGRGVEGKRRRKSMSNCEHKPWPSFSCASVGWCTAPYGLCPKALAHSVPSHQKSSKFCQGNEMWV